MPAVRTLREGVDWVQFPEPRQNWAYSKTALRVIFTPLEIQGLVVQRQNAAFALQR